MCSNKEIQMITCLGKRGPYSFYKSVKIGEQTLSLSQFFPVKIWPDSAILSIAEVQLLWSDKSEHFCSLRLYFLPENTPEGRRSHHGEDEVIALQDKVIIRASDLSSWLVDESDWHWGFVIPDLPKEKPQDPPVSSLSKAFLSEKYRKNDKVHDAPATNRLVVLNYVRYSRLRAVLKRLEGSNELGNWLSHPLVLALGGRNLGPNCRLLFVKEVFDYPELEDHELLCNHLAPKLKGRPRRGGRKRNPSLGSESNESETSSAGSRASDKAKRVVNGVFKPKFDSDKPRSPNNMHLRNVNNPVASELTSNGIKVESEQNGKAKPTKRRSTRRKRTYSQLENENSPTSSDGSAASGKANEDEDGKVGVPVTNANENIDKANSMPPRPSVITIQESASNPEPEYPRTKKMKTELNASSNIDAGRKSMSPPKSGSPAHQAISSLIIGNTISLPDTKILPSIGIKFDGQYVDKKHAILPPKTSRSAVSKSTKAGLPKVEFDFKKPQSIPSGFCSPSPFISTLYYASPKIYGDPIFKKNPPQQQQQQPVVPPAKTDLTSKYRPNVLVPNPPNNGIIDFSVRKGESSGKNPSKAPMNLNVSSNLMEMDILNLSVKPGAANSGAGPNNIFHNLADIPPPNAMNKSGMRLTSEVTLFPSHPGQSAIQQQILTQHPPQTTNSHQKPKRERDNSSARGSSGRVATQSPAQHQHLPPVPQMNPSNQRSRNHNPMHASHAQSVPMSRPGASNNVNSTLNSNPHVWRPMSASQSSSKVPAFQMESHLHQAATNNYVRNSKSTKAPPPAYGGRDRAPALTVNQLASQNHRNSSVKVSQQLAALQQQERAAVAAAQQGREREAREKALEMENWSAGFAPFLQPPPYYPKIDPAAAPYMPLFGAAPYLLPPAGLMGLPPGTMEQFQLYKDLLLQQGLPPQFQPAGWPPHLGGSAGGSNHSNTKERK